MGEETKESYLLSKEEASKNREKAQLAYKSYFEESKISGGVQELIKQINRGNWRAVRRCGDPEILVKLALRFLNLIKTSIFQNE